MSSRIVKTKGILGGRPRINGTRIGVEHIMQYVNGGATIKEILEQYPDISGMDVQACIDYANLPDKIQKKREVIHGISH